MDSLLLIPLVIFISIIAVELIIFVLLIILTTLATIFWVMMLIDLIKRDDKEFEGENGKLIWILILVLTSWVGAIIYYFVVKRK